MLFADIPGLSETKTKIVQAIKNNHLAHALLFHGPEGSASLQLALALATYLHCTNPGEEDACGQCPSCQKMSKLIHPDMNFAFPMPGEQKDEEEEKKEKKIDFNASFRKFAIEMPYGNVSDWIYANNFEKRQLNISRGAARLIIKTLSLKSFEGGYKIMLIWGVEYMNPTSANALLKIIEEPPAKTLFMLVTSRPEQLLTTILSRTQKIVVRAFTDAEVMAHLVASEKCSREMATQITNLSDGNMREAYRMVIAAEDQYTGLVRDWMRACYSVDINAIFSYVERIIEKDKESLKSLLLAAINIVREVMLDRATVSELMRSADSERDFIHKLGKNVLDEDKLQLLYVAFNEAHYHLARNGNPKIIFTDLSFKLARIMKSNLAATA